MTIVTGATSGAVIAGTIARLQVAPWVTGAGAGTFLDMGFHKDLTVNFSRAYEDYSADNVTWALGAMHTDSVVTIKGTLAEGDLRKLAQIMNDNPVATTGDVTVTVGAPTGTAIFAIDEPSADRYWQVKVSFPFTHVPAYTEDATASYATRTYLFYRCKFMPSADHVFKKGGVVEQGFEAKAYLDTSITYSKGVLGRIGTITDSE